MFGLRPAFPGGIRLPQSDSGAVAGPCRQMPFAPSLYLPLRQHPGRAAVARVREGQDVERGQVLAEAADESGVALHAPATGRVVRIADQADDDGGTVATIRLDPLPGDTQECRPARALDPTTAGADELLAAIRAAGLVGLGPGAEPTHARLARARGQAVDVLVVNAIDDEPVFRRMAVLLDGHGDEALAGTAAVGTILGAGRVVLAVEERDADRAAALLARAPRAVDLRLCVLPARYPQGERALLLRTLAGAEPGFSPDRAEVFNLATLAAIGRLLERGEPMTDQQVSLLGGALRDPGHYRVPLGTPLRFALDWAGLRPGLATLLSGGPMRGRTLASLDRPIAKNTTGFVALDPAETGPRPAPLACIRCGECVAVCPVGLHPAELGLRARRGELAEMFEQYHLERCIECGCCAYVCPSHIPLVQWFRAAKAQARRTAPPATAGEGA